jgi:5-methylcytosine-specific restriction endonuclease McrA
MCGFIPVDRIQLDVDHKDGNRANNDPSNVWTLCANCHRLKTKRNKDGVYGQPKKN